VIHSSPVIPRLLRALLVLLGTGLAPAVADDWISEEHRCALKLPDGESWLAGVRQAIPVGRVIFHSNAMQTNEGIMVTVIPDLPAREVAGPALIQRITETLTREGFTPEQPSQITWLDLPSFEFIARRRDSVFGLVLGVARATLRGTDLFIVMAYGKGEADKAKDPHFMRVLDTFRFVEGASSPQASRPGPGVGSYMAGAIACAVVAALLAVYFFVLMYTTRELPDLA
jgi:hypothetical protein